MPEQFDKSTFQGVFKIDNIDFTAGLININRKVNILDRYAERTINGDLKREIRSCAKAVERQKNK
jgi:hypothetical protein